MVRSFRTRTRLGGRRTSPRLIAGSHHVAIKKDIDGAEWVGAQDVVVQEGVNGPVRIPLSRPR